MVCNTGVGLTPRVSGRILHFESRGLYDGVSVLWDRETGTLWHHITGEAMYGPLKGHRLAPVSNLGQSTVGELLEARPDVPVAISDRPIAGGGKRGIFDRLRGLSARFRGTIAREDNRRPTMDIGIGVWTSDGTAKYYPLETVAEQGNAIIDTFGGRRLLVYFAPRSRVLRAIYSPASAAQWEGDVLALSTGHRIAGGLLLDPDGQVLRMDQPLQVFTRWYGFALTFPGTEIHGR